MVPVGDVSVGEPSTSQDGGKGGVGPPVGPSPHIMVVSRTVDLVNEPTLSLRSSPLSCLFSQWTYFLLLL